MAEFEKSSLQGSLLQEQSIEFEFLDTVSPDLMLSFQVRIAIVFKDVFNFHLSQLSVLLTEEISQNTKGYFA